MLVIICISNVRLSKTEYMVGKKNDSNLVNMDQWGAVDISGLPHL